MCKDTASAKLLKEPSERLLSFSPSCILRVMIDLLFKYFYVISNRELCLLFEEN